MTREQKIALILGFALVLVVGVLVSDHLSGAREATLVEIDMPDPVSQPVTRTMPDRAHLAMGDDGAKPADRLTHLKQDDPPIRENERPRLASEETGDDPVGLDAMRDQVADAIRELTNGNGPRAAAQTDTITMGEPIRASERRLEPESIRTHIVRRGETLWRIAERYYGSGFAHTQLREYNRARIRSARDLNPGLTLLIPPRRELGSAPPAPAHDVVTRPERPRTTAATRTYTVRKGDTLSEISQKELGTSRRWEEILSLNAGSLDEATDIRVGMKLTLPAR